MELTAKELNELLEAAAERGATKALQAFTGTQPVVMTKNVSPAIRYPNLAQMSSKDYWMAEIERVKLENKAIRASGDKTKKLVRLAPMRNDPIYMEKLKSEFISDHNARLDRQQQREEKKRAIIDAMKRELIIDSNARFHKKQTKNH